MSLKSELQALKIDKALSLHIFDVEKTLKELAASGKTSAIFIKGLYSQETIDYLRSEGLNVTEVPTWTNGDYFLIEW